MHMREIIVNGALVIRYTEWGHLCRKTMGLTPIMHAQCKQLKRKVSGSDFPAILIQDTFD